MQRAELSLSPPRPRGSLPGPCTLVSALLALLGGACSTVPDKPGLAGAAQPAEEEAPYVPLAQRSPDEERSVGKYLAELDAAIRAWMDKTWNASTREDRQKQDKLELYLEGEARRGQTELLVQLESGPLKNRIIAATALGFTRDPAVLSPLLGALEDPSSHVVQNALIGLSLLLSPDTPLERVAELMHPDREPELRGSAAYCARCLVEVGACGAGVLETARAGVVDSDPIVRSQSALILALLLDPDAILPLSMLLGDDVELVVAAAARSLAYVGREMPERKGDSARALTAALTEADKPLRTVLLRNLVALSEKNYGNDDEAWQAWSHRLP